MVTQFGSNHDTARLIATLNFDLTLVTSVNCKKNCTTAIYNASASKTSNKGNYSLTNVSTVDNGNSRYTVYKGSTIKDQVCLSNGACLPQFEFFQIGDGPDKVTNEGILGLMPSPVGSGRLSFGEYLKANNLIDQHIVTMYVGPKFGLQNYLTFGGYEPSLLHSSDGFDVNDACWIDFQP